MKSIEIVSSGVKFGNASVNDFIDAFEVRIQKSVPALGKDLIIRMMPEALKTSGINDNVAHFRLYSPDKEDVEKLRNALEHFRGLPTGMRVVVDHVLIAEAKEVWVE